VERSCCMFSQDSNVVHYWTHQWIFLIMKIISTQFSYVKKGRLTLLLRSCVCPAQ
jgi:hypothetical protein